MDNGLDGKLPPELSLLTDMWFLDLAENFLSGPIPTELFAMESLSLLHIGHNLLTGTIPTEIGQLSNQLTWFYLNTNFLSGTIPTGPLTSLTKLSLLGLGFMGLEGSLEAGYEQLTMLSYLSLTANELTGTIPDILGLSWTRMTRLFMGDNLDLKGTFPTTFGLLTDLEVFYLNDNDMTGTIPTELRALRSLETFSVADTSLTGSVNDIFCGEFSFPFIDILVVDCLGPDPEIECSCCSDCCPCGPRS